MVNNLLVVASIKALEDILVANDIPFGVENSEAYKSYLWVWDRSDQKQLALRQAEPAIQRIISKEPYVFKTGGDPLFIRVNDQTREPSGQRRALIFPQKESRHGSRHTS